MFLDLKRKPLTTSFKSESKQQKRTKQNKKKRITLSAMTRSSLPWEKAKGTMSRVLELPVRHLFPNSTVKYKTSFIRKNKTEDKTLTDLS